MTNPYRNWGVEVCHAQKRIKLKSSLFIELLSLPLQKPFSERAANAHGCNLQVVYPLSPPMLLSPRLSSLPGCSELVQIKTLSLLSPPQYIRSWSIINTWLGWHQQIQICATQKVKTTRGRCMNTANELRIPEDHCTALIHARKMTQKEAEVPEPRAQENFYRHLLVFIVQDVDFEGAGLDLSGVIISRKVFRCWEPHVELC